MKYEDLRDDFRAQVITALEEFSKTEQNKAVYAIAFDCDTENGAIVLRYANSEVFEKLKESWDDAYADMYKPYGQNGLFGLKYSVGDFEMLKYEYSGLTSSFQDSFYFYSVGDYYGEGEPISEIEIDGRVLAEEELEDEINDVFERMIIETIEEVKNMPSIDFDKDSLVFMCDHDISNEDFKMWVRKTNDEELVERLAKIKD